MKRGGDYGLYGDVTPGLGVSADYSLKDKDLSGVGLTGGISVGAGGYAQYNAAPFAAIREGLDGLGDWLEWQQGEAYCNAMEDAHYDPVNKECFYPY